MADILQLDRTDKRILHELQRNARITNQELADKVGLSPSPCLRRVKALEDAGLILGHVTLLDAKKLGLSLMALVQVSMDKHTPERFANFENAISACPEVLECLLITGQAADYQIKVVVPDMDAYQQFLLGKLTQIEGVTGVHSSFVLRKVVNHNALPV
jgi:Lrp/AsnC family transcriptional regulator, leucine-responsive regulatory protein